MPVNRSLHSLLAFCIHSLFHTKRAETPKPIQVALPQRAQSLRFTEFFVSCHHLLPMSLCYRQAASFLLPTSRATDCFCAVWLKAST